MTVRVRDRSHPLPLWAKLAAVLLSLGCTGFVSPPGTYQVGATADPAIIIGYNSAADCVRAEVKARPTRPAWSVTVPPVTAVRLWLVPGLSFDDQQHSSTGANLPWQGVTPYGDRDIYIAEMALGNASAWGHEWLHVFLKEHGHPPIFRACGL